MGKQNKSRLQALACMALLGAMIFTTSACSSNSNSNSTNPTSSVETEGDVIKSNLKESYEAGEEVDLTPTVATGWTYTISIRKGNTPILSNSTKTSYTFTQTGSYTIIYNATNGSQNKSLTVEISVTPKMGDSFVTFDGTNYSLVCYSGSIAKIYDKKTNEEVLSTEYQYTRTIPGDNASHTGFTFSENEVGPVFFIECPGQTIEATGMNKYARSICTGNTYTIDFDYTQDSISIKDTFTLAKSSVDEKFSQNDPILTFEGNDSVFGPSYLYLYNDSLCSAYFLGSEITAGRYMDTSTLYGGGNDANHFGGGFWSFSGDEDNPNLELEIGKDKYTVTKDATNKLNFTYVYSISSYKRTMTMSTTASYWVPALLNKSATKVTFTGTKTELTCVDDTTKTVLVNMFNEDGSKKRIQTGNWDFNNITRVFTITLDTDEGKEKIPVTRTEEGRLTITYSNEEYNITGDLLETSLDWEGVFPLPATEVLTGSGNLTTLFMGDGSDGGGENPTDITSRIVNDGLFTLSIYDDNTYMVVGSGASDKGHTDTGTYEFKNNVYTFSSTRDIIGTFSTTYVDGTYSLTYPYPMRGYINPVEISFTPKAVLMGALEDRTFVLTTQNDGRAEMIANKGDLVAVHDEVGTYTEENGVYTFSFDKGGTFTYDGTNVNGAYKYTSGGTEYEIQLSKPANQN